MPRGRQATAWRRSPWFHSALLSAGLVVVLPFTAPRSSFTSDEGAYALEAAAVNDGHWSYEYALEDLDPAGERFPVVLTPRGDDGRWYPYVHHPLWVVMLAASVDLVGETWGLHLLSLIAVVVAAGAAWRLAALVDRAVAPLAFWLAASGPVLVNGYITWAHAASAAVAGIGFVVAAGVGSRKARVLDGGLLAMSAAGGVFLRSEGLFVGPALAVVVVVAARRLRPVAALPIAAAVVALLLERRWVNAILSGGYASPDRTESSAGLLQGRIRGAWHTLFDGSYAGAGYAVLLVVALAVMAVGLRAKDDRVAVVGGAVATALIALRWVQGPDDSVTGLLVAWPVAGAGMLRALRAGRPPPAVVAIAMGAGVIAVAVLTSQYDIGGGLEWGGRFLSPVTVPVAVVAAIGVATLSGRARRAVAAVSAATAAMGLGILIDSRHDVDRFIAAIEARRPAVVVTDMPALPRLAWRTHDDFAWWLVDDRKELEAAVADLERAGRGRVVTVTEDGIQNIRSK